MFMVDISIVNGFWKNNLELEGAPPRGEADDKPVDGMGAMGNLNVAHTTPMVLKGSLTIHNRGIKQPLSMPKLIIKQSMMIIYPQLNGK